MASSIGSFLYYTSPSASSSQSGNAPESSLNELQTLLEERKVMEICTKYPNHWGYILSAYCQCKKITNENEYLRDFMAYSLSTNVGVRMLKEFPHYYDPMLRNIPPKSLSYGMKDFEQDSELNKISPGVPIDPELESNIDFLKSTFRKGWTYYLNYTDQIVHALLDVLSDSNVNPEPYLDYLKPVKKMCIYMNLSLKEYELLCKLLPDELFDVNFDTTQLSYKLGIFDVYYRLDGTDYTKVKTLIGRCLFRALEDKESWIQQIHQKNKDLLETYLKDSDICGYHREDIVKNTTDVLGENVLDYQPFDIEIYQTIDGNIYLFSRPEFENLLTNSENIYTREPLTSHINTFLNYKDTIATNNMLPAALPLRELMDTIQERISAEELFRDLELCNKVQKKSDKEVLDFMYINYRTWVQYNFSISSTIYSYFYRCFCYWMLLHSVDGNYVAELCIDLLSSVQMKFAQMTTKDCVSFIISSPMFQNCSKDYRLSFINFCSAWYRQYAVRGSNSDVIFVQECLTLLRKYQNK